MGDQSSVNSSNSTSVSNNNLIVNNKNDETFENLNHDLFEFNSILDDQSLLENDGSLDDINVNGMLVDGSSPIEKDGNLDIDGIFGGSSIKKEPKEKDRIPTELPGSTTNHNQISQVPI